MMKFQNLGPATENTRLFSSVMKDSHSLLNEENPTEPLEEIHPIEGSEKEITRNEIETAIEKIKNKAPGPSGMTVETMKAVGGA